MSASELTRAALREFPLPEQSDGGKDDHGRLLIVAGSPQVPGAALLSARSALRSGAGKVRIATAESVAPAMALQMVEALIVPLQEAGDGSFAPSSAERVEAEAESADAIVAGPGVKRSDVNAELAAKLLRSGKPIAFDAAMLHCLAEVAPQCRDSQCPAVLLPHTREMASLLQTDEESVEADRLSAARKAAEHFGAVVLAKGAESHIVAPDGRSWTFRGGAPGLGVAGSGDTLAGIVGALLARGADPLTALLWSVLLHGEAGEMLSAKVGPVGFLAREIPDEIPALLAR
ncbi:MAG: NAD(P)H-hydrate dehydratase [Sphingomicrobium sp.]